MIEDERALDVARRVLKEIRARRDPGPLKTAASSPLTPSRVGKRSAAASADDKFTPTRPQQTGGTSSNELPNQEPFTPPRSGFWERLTSSRAFTDSGNGSTSSSSSPNTTPERGPGRKEKLTKKKKKLIRQAHAVEDELKNWQQQLAAALDKVSGFDDEIPTENAAQEETHANSTGQPLVANVLSPQSTPKSSEERKQSDAGHSEEKELAVHKPKLVEQNTIANGKTFEELPLTASSRTLGALAATQKELLRAFEGEMLTLKMEKETAESDARAFKAESDDSKHKIETLEVKLEAAGKVEAEAKKVKAQFADVSSKSEKYKLKLGECECELFSARKIITLLKGEQKGVEADKIGKLKDATAIELAGCQLKISELEFELEAARKVSELLKAEQAARDENRIVKIASDLKAATKAGEALREDRARREVEYAELSKRRAIEVDTLKQLNEKLQESNEKLQCDLQAVEGKAARVDQLENLNTMLSTELEDSRRDVWDSINASTLQMNLDTSEQQKAIAESRLAVATDQLQQFKHDTITAVDLQRKLDTCEQQKEMAEGRLAAAMKQLQQFKEGAANAGELQMQLDTSEQQKGELESRIAVVAERLLQLEDDYIDAGELQEKLDTCEKQKQAAVDKLAAATERLLSFENQASSNDLYQEELKESCAAAEHVAKKNKDLIIKNNLLQVECELNTSVLTQEVIELKAGMAALKTQLDGSERQLARALLELANAEKKLVSAEVELKQLRLIESKVGVLMEDFMEKKKRHSKETTKLARMLDQVCSETDLAQEALGTKTAQLAIANEHISKLLCLRKGVTSHVDAVGNEVECID